MTRAVVHALGVLVIGVLGALAGTARAEGERELARQHYQTGQKKFDAGDLQGAILSFAAADALVPSPLLSYNIAICHERLGDPDAAIRRYEEYLRRRPDAPNRAEIEARMAALEPPLEQAPAETLPTRPPASDDGLSEPRSTDETPGAEQPPRRIPYDEVFARRLGPLPAPSATPRPDEMASPPPPPVGAPRTYLHPQPPPQHPGGPMGPSPEPARARPFYKQWWFWVFVGVGAIIAIDIAASDGDDGDRASARPTAAPPPVPAGVLLRF